MAMKTISEQKTFGGTLGYYSHASKSCDCDMRFTVFVPAQADAGAVPVLTWLSGLTCTEDNFTVKAGAYDAAARHGVMVVAPDTSPRGEGVADDEAYDLGQGAGFYLDAARPPWQRHFSMASYITADLQDLMFEHFPGDKTRQGLFGHSMGGHGALTLWLKHPDIYQTVSAFAPICAPSQCPWGYKAFGAYLGEADPDGAVPQTWLDHDACALVRESDGKGSKILVDQGLADGFLADQLKPELLEQACAKTGQALELRRQEGYDHSYFFIASFIADHIAHHAAQLNR
jgi:S-formylglutathione hydrolase